MSSLSPRMADAMLMLGLGVGIALVVRGVSFGLHTIYRDTEVAEDPDPPHAVSQGTEEDIPLSSLGMLATTHQNLEVRKAAIVILTNRFLSDTANIRALLNDARQPPGTPHQRAAELAITMIRETHGVDLEEWDARGQRQHVRHQEAVHQARQLWEVLPSEPDEHGRWEMQPSSRYPFVEDRDRDAAAEADDSTSVQLTFPLLPRNAPAPEELDDDEDDDEDNDNWDGALLDQHARITRNLTVSARRRRDRSEEVARRRVRREAVVINNGDRPITQDDIFQRPPTRSTTVNLLEL
ncbi:uncharacterized protein J3D65DRAFT_616929 [Phyllosticta citribraziliensis]|uniref:Uncharacterized protein n=1 Tax=Phyllosticta citribraziliensis TaxID=989973 RepID=A0ABR1M0F5_9PEZI